MQGQLAAYFVHSPTHRSGDGREGKDGFLAQGTLQQTIGDGDGVGEGMCLDGNLMKRVFTRTEERLLDLAEGTIELSPLHPNHSNIHNQHGTHPAQTEVHAA